MNTEQSYTLGGEPITIHPLNFDKTDKLLEIFLKVLGEVGDFYALLNNARTEAQQEQAITITKADWAALSEDQRTLFATNTGVTDADFTDKDTVELAPTSVPDAAVLLKILPDLYLKNRDDLFEMAVIYCAENKRQAQASAEGREDQLYEPIRDRLRYEATMGEVIALVSGAVQAVLAERDDPNVKKTLGSLGLGLGTEPQEPVQETPEPAQEPVSQSLAPESNDAAAISNEPGVAIPAAPDPNSSI